MIAWETQSGHSHDPRSSRFQLAKQSLLRSGEQSFWPREWSVSGRRTATHVCHVSGQFERSRRRRKATTKSWGTVDHPTSISVFCDSTTPEPKSPLCGPFVATFLGRANGARRHAKKFTANGAWQWRFRFRSERIRSCQN